MGDINTEKYCGSVKLIELSNEKSYLLLLFLSFLGVFWIFSPSIHLIVLLWQVFVSTLKIVYQLIAEKITLGSYRDQLNFSVPFRISTWLRYSLIYSLYPLCKSVVMVTINLYWHIIHQWKYRQLFLNLIHALLKNKGLKYFSVLDCL